MKALVLAGGGAKGAFQAGVMQALYEKGEHFDMVIGTSVGSINGFLWAYCPELLKLEWMQISGNKDVLRSKWWKLFWMSGLYDLKPLEKRIKKLQENVDMPRCRFICVVTDMMTGELQFRESLNQDEVRKAIIASSSIPSHMEPVDGRYMDGGIREVTAVERAYEYGATEVTAITNAPHKFSQDDLWETGWPYVLDYGLRAIDIMQEEISWNDLKHHRAVRHFHPDKNFVDTLEFDSKKIKKAFDHGYNKGKV